MTNRAIGIMGGTFDPVHYGHLVTAESVRAHYGLQEVVFVPTGMPPHKSPEQVSQAEHRYLMTVLATATNPAFSVSRSEIDRPGPSFTADTVREVRQSRGPLDEIVFITGADAVRQLPSWSRLDEIFQHCEVVAASRPGYPFAEFEQEIALLPRPLRRRIHFLEVPALAISSVVDQGRLPTYRVLGILSPPPGFLGRRGHSAKVAAAVGGGRHLAVEPHLVDVDLDGL